MHDSARRNTHATVRLVTILLTAVLTLTLEAPITGAHASKSLDVEGWLDQAAKPSLAVAGTIAAGVVTSFGEPIED